MQESFASDCTSLSNFGLNNIHDQINLRGGSFHFSHHSIACIDINPALMTTDP